VSKDPSEYPLSGTRPFCRSQHGLWAYPRLTQPHPVRQPFRVLVDRKWGEFEARPMPTRSNLRVVKNSKQRALRGMLNEQVPRLAHDRC
jgi:hypothetical protein